MYQPQPPDPDPDDLEQLGQPIYQGDGLQVRGLTEEDLARFLAAHAGQPARLLGSGWNHFQPTETPSWGPPNPAGPLAVAGPPRGSYGAPGASARAIYRRLRAAELADWSRSLVWRLALIGGA